MSTHLRHFIFYIFSFFIVSISVNNGFSQNRYWVNGSGNWNDTNHWSESSGGIPGANIPTKDINVVFDDNSFTSSDQTVFIKESVECKDFHWNIKNIQPSLKSKSFLFKTNTKAEIQLYGSLYVNENISNQFFGDIVLKSNEKSEINIKSDLNSDVLFASEKGKWDLKSDLKTSGDISVLEGKLSLNANIIETNAFISSGNLPRSINISDSKIITNVINFEQSQNLNLQSDNYKVEIKNKISEKSVKSGDIPIIVYKAGAKATFNIDSVTVDSTSCYNGNDGSITVYVSGGTSPYYYTLAKRTSPTTWADTLSASNSGPSYTFVGLRQNGYKISVEDTGPTGGGFAVDSVYHPDKLVADSIGVNQGLSCSYSSDAELEAYASGGNPAYSYQWLKYNTGTGLWDVITTDDPANKVLTGVSQGWYTVNVTDQNGCGDLGYVSTEIFFLEGGYGYDNYIPSTINITGVSSTNTCSGFSTGTITVSATGGTAPLKYAIVRISDSDSTIEASGVFTGLQADTYKVYAIDANDCFKKYDTDITIDAWDNPTVNITPDPADACPGKPFQLYGNPTHGDGTSFTNHLWTGAGTAYLDDTGIENPVFNHNVVGGYNLTYEVTDNNGCTGTDVITVNVDDTEDPVAVCHDITVQLDATGNVSIAGADVDGGSSDNCSAPGDLVFTVVPNSFDCTDIGANAVTLTVTDETGNWSNCAAIVTVEDNIAPTAVCQDITVQLDATGNVSITPADIDNGSSDNCSDYTLSLDQTDFTCADIGVNTVILTIDDQHGQTDNCTATVTVEDNLAPTAICQDITVQLDATGNVSITPADVDNGSSDNCSDFTLSLDQTDFTCADIGANMVTLTIDDQHGQTDNCTATVTVEDNFAPTAVCQDITVYLDATGNVSITPADVDNGSSDNCSDFILSLDQTDFTCADIGANTVTLTINDQHGQTDNCTATVTVVDNLDPTAVCQDITVQLDATGNVSIAGSDVDGGSSDNCTVPGNLILSVVPNSFDCTDIGANTVTLTVTDEQGNSSNCIATVTVEDNLAPTAVCQDITVELDATGNVSITPGDVDNGSGDNCSDFTLSLDQTDFTCADLGANTVTLTIDDQHGQTDNCTAIVTVEDNIAPTAVCQDITVYLDATGNVSITPADIDNGSSDNCSDFTLSLDQTDFTCADIGANTVTLTINDQHGQTDNCTATVTVLETEDPVAVCQDITVQLDATGNVSIAGADVDGGSSDNCSAPGDLVFNVVPNSFDCADIGANTVTLTVTDEAGNSSNCTAIVTVEDNLAPTAICQDITVQLDATGNVSITPGDVDNGSGDNCSDFTLSLDQTDFTCADIGANTVTLTIDDQHGQTDNCTATVTVEDNFAPTAVCQDITVYLDATGNVSITPADVDNGSSDNCSDFILSLDQTDFTCADIGANTVTLTINDQHGQTDNCTATVTVVDNLDPTAVCQDITVQLDATGNVSIAGSDVDGGSSDNCTVPGNLILSVVPNSFDCTDIGANTVTLTVTDEQGNSSNCIATVTVEDNLAPTAVCQDITVELDATGNVSITPGDVDNGSGDNCSDFTLSLDQTDFTCADLGANTVTLTIDDQHGQTDNCTATVTVEDNIAPSIISCPGDISVLENGTCSAVVNGLTPVVSDNCTVTVQTWTMSGATINTGVGDVSGETFNIGITTVTYHFEDAAGNFVECSFDVEIYDVVDGGEIDADQTVCYNTTPNPFISVTPASVCGGLTYQWQMKSGSSPWGDILGATNETYTELNPLTEVTLYNRKAISDLGFGTEYSDTITINIQPEAIAFAGIDTTLCFDTPYYLQDADTVNSDGVTWEILTGNGDITVADLTKIDPVYTPDISDGGTTVELVLHASGKGSCGESTDTVRINYLSELLVSIGKPAPFYIDSMSTHIDVYFKIEDHRFLGDLALYLVSPLDSVVELKSFCSLGIPAPVTDLTAKFYNDPYDTSTVYTSNIDECNPTSGNYKFVGDWKKKLHGQDPTNGAWRVRVADNRSITGSDGYLREATVTFSDTNRVGLFESILLADSSINMDINESPGGGIVVNTDRILPITGLSTSCFGLCDATAVATASGGQAPYVLYEWSEYIDFSVIYASGVTADTVDLCAGRYYVRVTDSHGCTAIDSILVSEPPEIVITKETVIHNKCNGDEEGKVVLEFTGGVGTLRYSYDGLTYYYSGDTVFNLAADTYTFTIEDANCSITRDIEIKEPSELIIDNIDITPITCHDADDGKIEIFASGGTPGVITPYYYSVDSADTWIDNRLFENLEDKKYITVVQDSLGCITYGDTIYLSNPDTISIDSVKVVPTTCAGTGNDGQIIIYASGGVVGAGGLEYSLNGTDYQFNNTFTGLPVCDTTVFVRDNCETKQLDTLVSVTGPIPIEIDSVVVDDVNTCFGESTGQITVYAKGGTGNFTYSIDGVDNIPPESNVFSGYPAGTYTVRVTDDGGCTSPDSTAVIDQPTQVIIDSYTVTHTSECNTPTDVGEITLNGLGGTPTYRYALVNNTDSLTNSTGNFTGLSPDSYWIYAIDFNDCASARLDTSIILYPAMDIRIDGTDIGCHGETNGSASVVFDQESQGVMTYNYSWENSSGVGIGNSQLVTGLSSGWYYVTVTDNNSPDNCIDNDSIQIIEPDPFTIVLNSKDVYCIDAECKAIDVASANGYINPGVSGGTGDIDYNWVGPNGFSSQDDFITNLKAGTYFLTVTDSRGCDSIVDVTINPNDDYDITELSVEFLDTSVCWNQEATFRAEFDGYSDTIFYQIGEYVNGGWSYRPETFVEVGTSPMLVGDYLNGDANYRYIRVTNQYCYQDTLSAVVNIDYIPSFQLDIIDELDGNAEDDTIYLKGARTGTIGANVNDLTGITFEWYESGVAISGSDVQILNISPDSSAYYTVVASTSECIDSSRIYLEFIPAITPNEAFTPNGDGINDYWRIKFIEKFQNNVVTIYNRWGTKVFEQKGYTNEDESKMWDGRAKNGKDLPSGTYYYVIILNEAGFQPITGPITIIR